MIFMVNICKSIISVDTCRPRFNQDFDMMRFLASPSPAPERKVRMELGKIVGQVAEVYGSLSLLYGFLETVFSFWGDSTSTIFFCKFGFDLPRFFWNMWRCSARWEMAPQMVKLVGMWIWGGIKVVTLWLCQNNYGKSPFSQVNQLFLWAIFNSCQGNQAK